MSQIEAIDYALIKSLWEKVWATQSSKDGCTPRRVVRYKTSEKRTVSFIQKAT